jgi:uncharacterized protein YceK
MDAFRSLTVLPLVVLLFSGCAATTTAARPDAGGAQPASSDDFERGADAANIWYVPGRALTCFGSGVLAFVTMTLTFGQGYDTAAQLMTGGCGGPWTLQAQDIRDAVPRR